MPAMRLRCGLLVLLAVAFLCTGSTLTLYNLPSVYARIDGYASIYRSRAQQALNPTGAAAPVSQEQVGQIVQATLQAYTAVASLEPGWTATPAATGTATLLPSATPTLSPTPSPTVTPIPAYVELSGVQNQVETRNNCGPATLAMALSYWGWQGDQTIPQAVLRPNPKVDDKNVMPAELAAYVQSHTGLRALVRVGGDLDLIKRLIAAGFPVIVEKGHTTTGWIGHYILLTGYDDARGHFLSQDSLIVSPDQPVPYAELAGRWWRHFNYLYLVIYPTEREPEMLAILGPHTDAAYNFETAAEKARQEISQFEGRELFFAWFNLGSSLAGLGDFSGAAQAFDTAYADVYPGLSKEERPWRALWYRTEPYLAYYSTGRYSDVIALAGSTLAGIGKPIHEESLFWRGMAREALGDVAGAIADYEKAARLNPGSTSALEQVRRLSSDTP
jgi:hypothetical protein